MKNNIVLYKPLFRLKPFGHGGEKRSSQVHSLLQSLNLRLYADVRIPLKDQAKYSFQHTKQFLAFLSWLKYTRKSPIPLSINFLRKLSRALKVMNYLKPGFVIVENTNLTDYYVVEAAKYFNAFVCIIPHNIESLVATQSSPYSKRVSPHWLEEEMSFLRKADIVYAISKYDEWLFSCNNINTKFLPYFPLAEVLVDLQQVRAQRMKQGNKSLVLILGTVKNQPTREGLRKLVDFLENSSPKNNSYLLAGFDVEKHFDGALYKNVQIAGAVTNEVLNQFLIDCKCVLIHHQPSSGALTRVTECITAGIPVVGNFYAVKDVMNKKGIYAYHRFTDLNDILSNELEIPEIPDARLFEKAFVENIDAAIGDNKN